jgi:hypothetical protein
MVDNDLFEFTYGGVHHVARVALYPGGGGWGRVDVFRGARVIGCGEFSRRGLVYLTLPIKPMRGAIERMIDAYADASA